MHHKYLELLIYLADKTKLFAPLETSTNEISSDLKISQQTISRKLREMEKLNLITRSVNYRGHIITLTQNSIDLLKEHSKKLQNLLKNKKTSITGTIKDGSGEGSYYTSLKKYKEKIKQKLGFKVYPGTLNVKISKEEIKPFLNSLTPIRIYGFKTKERAFGEITCYKIKFKNINTAIVVPERTRYEDILEIIAPFSLRNKFNLKTGDKITIKNETGI
ncbi:MAG: CTP-dependent riboflavin kinase [Nanoarchaeota archaeon]|nr:CTP-dependent riboflavin kinase [Nanoarchaeota archaeon]